MDKIYMSIREYWKTAFNEKGNNLMEAKNKKTKSITILRELNALDYTVYQADAKEYVDDGTCENLVWQDYYTIMPTIVDVKVYNDKSNNLPCAVAVKFSDGTMEKCSCSKADSFSLEMGISICVTKKLLSMKSSGSGHNIYNKIIDKGLKIYKRNRQAEATAAEKKIADKLAVDRKEAKRRARRERKKKAEDERQIACYMEAMRRVKAEKSDKAKAEKKK